MWQITESPPPLHGYIHHFKRICMHSIGVTSVFHCHKSLLHSQAHTSELCLLYTAWCQSSENDYLVSLSCSLHFLCILFIRHISNYTFPERPEVDKYIEMKYYDLCTFCLKICKFSLKIKILNKISFKIKIACTKTHLHQ